MSPQIKLTVTQNDQLIETVTKATEKENFIKSLEEFQLEANAALTKMIEELGDIDEAIGDTNMDDEDDDDDENKDEEANELKAHSESKKKKH